MIISPDGVLASVPFSMLLPGRDLAMAPSGTAYALLAGDRALRGEGVLALGDPAYGPKAPAGVARGGALSSLPHTREEAQAVGGAVGDVVLLGDRATESGFLAAVAKRKRWRAVHLACHGLLDEKRPRFSALALTPDEKDDGLLTVLEVFRSRFPADLAVLSACDTGRGAVVEGEGTLGLTRAFLFAGAPRVLCSLWKVDDAATLALMTKFYAAWNPKDGTPPLSAAAALRAAQEHVRSQERWEHPSYWAAWVLWGLPE